MKRLLCYLKAIPFFLKTGVWCPHIYIEVKREKAIVISTDNSFRVASNFIHKSNETVHPHATLMRNSCKCCGKEDLSWFDGNYEDIPVLENEN